MAKHTQVVLGCIVYTVLQIILNLPVLTIVAVILLGGIFGIITEARYVRIRDGPAVTMLIYVMLTVVAMLPATLLQGVG
jgi:ABC-type uncharacterized transport system permease subunit